MIFILHATAEDSPLQVSAERIRQHFPQVDVKIREATKFSDVKLHCQQVKADSRDYLNLVLVTHDAVPEHKREEFYAEVLTKLEFGGYPYVYLVVPPMLTQMK